MIEEVPAPKMIGLRVALQPVFAGENGTALGEEIAAEVFSVPDDWRYLVKVYTVFQGSAGTWPACSELRRGPVFDFAPGEPNRG